MSNADKRWTQQPNEFRRRNREVNTAIKSSEWLLTYKSFQIREWWSFAIPFPSSKAGNQIGLASDLLKAMYWSTSYTYLKPLTKNDCSPNYIPYTYISGHYNSSLQFISYQDYGLASRITYIVRINLYT